MLKTHNFYVRSFLFVSLSIVGAAVSYLLYPALTRILSLSQFGDFVTIIGLSNQLLGILLAFSVISIALIKQFGEKDAENKTEVIQRVLLWLFLILAAVVLILSPLLQHSLKIQHSMSFVILSLLMILSVPSNIWVGFLQGHKEQIRVGIFSVVLAVLKFAFVVLLAAHFSTVGGLWGFFIGSAIGLLVLHLLPGKSVPPLKSIFKPLKPAEKSFLHSYRGFIAQSVFVVAGIVFLQNFDINLAKLLFTPTQAGLYGGISILSNALYFVAFLLIWIVLPEFDADRPKDNRRVLRTAYLLLGTISFVVVLAGIFLGNRALPTILGSHFANQGTVLVFASLYQISLVAVALYAFYMLVLRRRRSMLLVGCVLVCCLTIPLAFKSNTQSMITALWLSVVTGCAIYWLLARLFLSRKSASVPSSASTSDTSS